MRLPIVLSLVAISLVVAGPADTAAPRTQLDSCVDQYSRGQAPPRESTQVVSAGGARAAGGVGIRLKVSSKDRAGAGSVTVAAPNDADVEALAEVYSATGRSVLEDAQAAGLGKVMIRRLCKGALRGGYLQLVAAGDGSIYDSLCVKDDSSQVRWEGCVIRYSIQDSDPLWRYRIDETQGVGEETSLYAGLTKGGVRNSYATSGADILKASPASDINDVNKCYNTSFGLTIAGFGASAGGTVCPDRWEITKTSISANPEYHKTEWRGFSYGTREATAVTGFRLKKGYTSAYTLGINWAYSL